MMYASHHLRKLVKSGPSPKKAREDSGPTEMSSFILEKVTSIEKKLSFLDELSLGLNCVVCKGIAKVLVVSPRCQSCGMRDV